MYLTTNRNLRRLTNVLDEAFGTWPFQLDQNGSAVAWQPAVDVSEDNEQVRIVAELPGVKPEDVKLSLENFVLTIRGEKKQDSEERNGRIHRYERSYGLFERAFVLPNTVDSEKVSADYRDGVLTIVVPKTERAKAREIPVKVG